MPETKSFIEVLEDEIRADLRRELETELRQKPSQEQLKASHKAGSFEAWMASHVGPVTFRPKRAYASKSQPSRETPRSAPHVAMICGESALAATFHAETPAELFALELLNRHSGLALPTSFSAADLKAVWRKAAMKTHPDRFSQSDVLEQTRATALFRELASAYETLNALIETQIAA